MWTFVKSIAAIPMASFLAAKSVNGLRDAVMTFIVPTLVKFAATAAIVWVVVEAIKGLYTVWDTFTSKTASQTWSETLSTNLKKSKQDIKDLADEIKKTAKINTPLQPGETPKREVDYVAEEQRKIAKDRSLGQRIWYALEGTERHQELKEIAEAGQQTIRQVS